MVSWVLHGAQCWSAVHKGVVVGCCGVLVVLFGGLRGVVVGVVVFVRLFVGLVVVVEGVVVGGVV